MRGGARRPGRRCVRPWSEDAALRAAVRRLREQGETVVCILPGHEHEGQEFECDREAGRRRRPMGGARAVSALRPEISKVRVTQDYAAAENAAAGHNVVVVGTQWGDEGKGRWWTG